MENKQAVSKFKAVIFDLDNTLADATTVGDTFFNPAFHAISVANKGHLNQDQLDVAFAECWFTAFDAVAKRHNFTEAMTKAGHDAFKALKVSREGNPTYHGYADHQLVQKIPVPCFLVTSGYRTMQDGKVDTLGIRKWFKEVIIDAIGEPHPADFKPGKQPIFAKIAADMKLQPHEVLVVGDNPISEIAAGKALGMVTVQILRPRVQPGEAATHRIMALSELWPIMGLGEGGHAKL